MEFLAAVGLYMATYDKDGLEDKWNLLYDWISDYTTQPEVYLHYRSTAEIQRRVKNICKYYAEQQDNDKFMLMEQIVCVTLIDGRLELEEKKRLAKIAKAISISLDALNLIIRKCSENVLTPNKKFMQGGTG